MDTLYNFNLSNTGSLSRACMAYELTDYFQVCDYIKNLPYGRNSDRSNIALVLKENKGTCATKHAFLSHIAKENSKSDISLFIGIYAMNLKNTKGIGNILELNNLAFIPEAHTYLKFGSVIHDFTNQHSHASLFINDLLYEEQISPKHIGDYKQNLHRSYIKQWIKEQAIPHAFEDIWRIREQCIMNLSS